MSYRSTDVLVPGSRVKIGSRSSLIAFRLKKFILYARTVLMDQLMFVMPTRFQSPTRYEQLAQRIHRQVNSSAAQDRRRTVISRMPGELMDDWDKLLDQLAIEESVRLTRLESGAVQLNWTNQHR